jgi:hypothetical protein
MVFQHPAAFAAVAEVAADYLPCRVDDNPSRPQRRLGAHAMSEHRDAAWEHALREALAELENAGYLAGVHTTRREVLLALGLDPVDEANEDQVKQARAKVNDLLGLDDEGDDD